MSFGRIRQLADGLYAAPDSYRDPNAEFYVSTNNDLSKITFNFKE
jgi:hypothetical protein